MITVTMCAAGFTMTGWRTTAETGISTAEPEELPTGSSPVSSEEKYSPLVVISPMPTRREFYAANDAARAEKDRHSMAEFRGMCDAGEGRPRVHPCVSEEYAASWFKGYDLAIVRIAARRLAQPESERRAS